jgi:hypothetical protein
MTMFDAVSSATPATYATRAGSSGLSRTAAARALALASAAARGTDQRNPADFDVATDDPNSPRVSGASRSNNRSHTARSKKSRSLSWGNRFSTPSKAAMVSRSAA